MDNVTLNLSAQEAVDVVNIIGQLPTQTNAYPLFQKLKAQVEAQIQPAPAPEAPAAAPVAN